MVGWSTVRTLLSFVLQHKLVRRQVDFSNAFVHADLPEGDDIYIEIPETFNSLSSEGELTASECCLKLKKSLYGLRAAPKMWVTELANALKNQGFT